MPLSATNNTQLNIVDETDVIVGQASRATIHSQGLLHREVHVWFVTPDRQIIFQQRTPKKDTFPGLLDATVGGHVELNQDYESAALCELQEETGLTATAADLHYLDKYRGHATDAVTGSTNNVYRAIYGYYFTGSLDQLAVEEGAGAGFVAIPLDDLAEADDHLRARLIPALLQDDYAGYFAKLAALCEHHKPVKAAS